MEYNNKTILITGLIIGGVFCIYVKNTDLASVIFGGLIGYLSKDMLPNTDHNSPKSIDDNPKNEDDSPLSDEISPLSDEISQSTYNDEEIA